MKQIFKVVILGLLISKANLAFSQTQDSYDYNSEFTWGVNKNSAGGFIGGFVFKKARKLNSNMLETFGLELMNVKHPQEVRQSSAITGNFFIYGKSNYLYAVRFQYGRDLILFSKAPQQGVEIKAVFAAGPSLGIVAPYYIEVPVDGGGFSLISNAEQYNPNNPNHIFSRILGTGNLFEGISNSKIQLGTNLKAAVNFELGFLKTQVTGFEVGVLVDSYFKKVEIMPSAENRAIFPTVFFTLFYGSRK
jgi:hypothetical protein